MRLQCNQAWLQRGSAYRLGLDVQSRDMLLIFTEVSLQLEQRDVFPFCVLQQRDLENRVDAASFVRTQIAC